MSEHRLPRKHASQSRGDSEPFEGLGNVVSDIEDQVRDVNARIDRAAGRPLWQAIAIGLLLGGVFVGSLLWLFELFVGFVLALVFFAALELTSALASKNRIRSKWLVVVVAVPVVPIAASFGLPGLVVALLGALGLAMAIRLLSLLFRRYGAVPFLTDLVNTALVLIYVPFLASFVVMTARAPEGVAWVFTGVVIVVCVDIAAYATGLGFGKTPLAPSISPKKTWEGFFGSLVAAVVAGVGLGHLVLQVHWWVGAVLGVVLLFSATLGDLVESLIKRNLGIKDISSWLPGHGGFLDRLDSMLPSMAMLYLMFTIFS